METMFINTVDSTKINPQEMIQTVEIRNPVQCSQSSDSSFENKRNLNEVQINKFTQTEVNSAEKHTPKQDNG